MTGTFCNPSTRCRNLTHPQIHPVFGKTIPGFQI